MGGRLPPPSSDLLTVPIQGGASEYDIDDIESISLTFRNPIEEPFEVVSPPLK